MITPSMVSFRQLAIASIGAIALSAPAALGQTKQEEAELLAAPTADLIPAELLAPAVRQAVANGVAALVARMTAEGNDHGLAFPPTQTVKLIEMVDVPAKRIQREEPVYEHEYAEIEKIVPVIQSGQPTGRFEKVKDRVVVKSKKVGTRMVEHLVPDKDGSEKMKVPKYGPGGPAAWALNLPGLNGMALYVLAKAGLAKHPATVRHAASLAEHASKDIGLPDYTFDVAWMAAGFSALGAESKHEALARRLIGKLIDGQIREKGEADGLWGPVCVNYGYFGKLMTLGQTVREELDVHLPKKLAAASPAEQEKLVAMGKQMAEFATSYERAHRDVFRAGTRMLSIQSPFAFQDRDKLPGMPYNVYQWVVSDVESTEVAAFAIAVAKQADLLPKETERLSIKGKKIHPPVRAEATIKIAAKRMADAIDDEGGATALAFAAINKGFEKSGFPAPAFATADAMPPMFDVQTACTCVTAQETLESLVAFDPTLDKQLAEPLQRARDRAKKIAARWYKESATPAAKEWRGMYVPMTVSHADLEKSGALAVPAPAGTDVNSLPWGPPGSLYRIVPGFRGLFAGESAKERLADDLFRQVAYRLVALQDQNGQWLATGSLLLSTASESIGIGRIANSLHKSLTRDPPVKPGVPDPVSYDAMFQKVFAGWVSPGGAVPPDAAAFPTLASLLFLVESIDGPVSLDGIEILPPPAPESEKPADPDKPAPRLAPVDAARQVVRPSVPRQELFDAMVANRWRRKAEPAPVAPAKPEEKPAAKHDRDKKQEVSEEEDDGLGKFEDLLK